MKKIVVICIVIIVLVSMTVSVGAWGRVLKPGDHVIDYKRLADSIRETAQMLQTVQNSLENLKNRILANTKINIDENKISTEIEKVIKPDGESLINPNKVFKDKDFYKSWEIEEALNDQEYNLKLAEEQTYTKKEATDVIQETINNQTDRINLQSEILSTQTDGILGEKQRANTMNIVNTLNTIDKTKTNGARFINSIVDQETKAAADRLDKEKIKAGQFYGYDPYNSSTFDEENRPPQEPALGFMRFGN
ncbi:hypothetical protein GXM21_12710 (plasmid) [Megamonas funiformis]|uniref:P-type conjugative transfer protein TrbJ n=1 Tax=Megamonas funiformis YIT 11815 TaxID=742816 RepID=A0ABP2NHS4_9FIRM|nr:hypothetical protein [Megamonas funiformis]EHR31894.1 hypothetical protein HMPREF9454_02457 [Megamonas funiformis YIT 11815]QIB61282.1 hypothetical protein GXM21_12710 [Megamonas funiformis]